MVAKARGRSSRRTPVWAVLCTVLGALLMVGSGGTLVAAEWLQARWQVEQADLFGEPDDGEEYGAEIEGPLNFLLAGLDTRPSRPHEDPRADAIILVHVTEDLQNGYLISLPRDAIVDIPAFEKTGFPGGRDRINSAMARGAQRLEGEELPSMERGFELLFHTVRDLTGIRHFDGGAVVRFEGFVEIVDALDGITVTLDEDITSRHRQPDGTHRPLGCGSYCGPQAFYEAGEHHLEGWQALDIARQRYGVTDTDYGRQANQQMILKAIMDQAFSRDVVTNPVALDRVIRAAGDALVFDGRGREPVDFAFALRELRPGNITSIGLPGTNVGTGDAYQGEQLEPEAYELFAALRQGRLREFVVANPDFIN